MDDLTFDEWQSHMLCMLRVGICNRMHEQLNLDLVRRLWTSLYMGTSLLQECTTGLEAEMMVSLHER
jgi:hypothetical protein